MIVRFLFLFLFSFVFCQKDYHLDGVVAVVGEEVILKSEILDRVSMVAKQKNISPQNQPYLFQKLFETVLQENVHRLVVLHFAKKDTSIVVSFDDIDLELDSRISYFIESFGSLSALEEAMGLTLSEIKEEYWEVVEQELLVDRFRMGLFSGVSVSRKEVFSFFEENKDSFPPSPDLVFCSLLESPISVSSGSRDSVFSFISSIKDSVDLGLLDFSVAAKKYSQDPGSAKNGGDLGFSKRGSFVSVYERAAFDLVVGEISLPIETEHGVHLIYLVDRLGEKIHTKHILFSFAATKEDKTNTKKTLEDLFLLVKNDPGLMDSLSLDSYLNNKNNSGIYSNYNKNLFPEKIISVLDTLEDYNYSSVFELNNSFVLLYKHKEVGGEKTTLENNWLLIENLALQKKLFGLFELWIEKQSNKIYVEVFSF